MPTITLSPHPDRWEITVEDLPAPITKVTISPDGLYVEAGRLRRDLIPWPELAALIDDGPHTHQHLHVHHAQQPALDVPQVSEPERSVTIR